jgi:hypothetical protein
MSVRNRVLPAGNQRVFGATVIASVMMFGVACHNGVETPISPSTTTEFVPAATSAALADDGDTASTRGGPLSFTMDEVAGSGYSGTCTVGTGGEGFRVKASGQGAPGQHIRLILQPTDPTQLWRRYTDVAQVDDRGNFRFGWNIRVAVTSMPSGLEVYCAVIPTPGSVELARGPLFNIP